MRALLAAAGLTALDLAQDIRVRDNGALRYVFNYGQQAVNIAALCKDKTLLLGEATLAPCGVAAWRR